MDADLDDSFILEDQLNNCRCCLRMLLDNQKSIEIDEKIRIKFGELAGMEVSY